VTTTDERPVVTERPAGRRAHRPLKTPAVRRFQLVAIGAVVMASLPYLWVLWDLWTGTLNPFRVNEQTTAPGAVEYDVQARALMHGHLSLPNHSIGPEAFIHDGRTYTYFGIFPSLIRMPVLVFTHTFDGRLSAPSLLLAWLVTALFGSVLLWRIRVVVRGDAPLGWGEALSYGALLFSILAGSVLVSLASSPQVYQEDVAWGVALAVGSLFALLGVVERPSWSRVLFCGLLVLLTNLNRATTGYACILGTVMVAAWFALGRGGPERRRWALPVLGVGALALVVGCAINLAKFDQLFGFPVSEQLLYNDLGYAHINGGKHFSLHFLPSTLDEYLLPGNLRLTWLFPFLALPELPNHLVAHTRLFNEGNTSSATASMPLLFGLGVWGLITTFTPHRPVMVRSLRLLVICTMASVGAILIYGTIYERFLADFMPFLVLASAIGMIDIWRRLDGKPRRARLLVGAGITVLTLFGFLANMGIAITPQDNWTQTQADHFVRTEQVVSEITGNPLRDDVVRGPTLQGIAPIGQLFILGDCKGLYISDGEGLPYYPSHIWRPVELAPHAPLCRALIGSAKRVAPGSPI